MLPVNLAFPLMSGETFILGIKKFAKLIENNFTQWENSLRWKKYSSQ